MHRLKYPISFIFSQMIPFLLGFYIEPSALLLLMSTGVITYLLLSFCSNGFKHGIISILIIVFIYLQLIVVPYSYYVTWFQISTSQIPSGVVTTTLCQIFSIIWIYYLSQVNSFKFTNIFYPITIGLIFSSFVFHNIYIYIVIFLLLLFNILIPVLLHNKKRYSIQLLFVFIIVSGISSLIYDNFKSGGSKLVNNNSYEIRNWVEKYLPFINLLSSIPGVHGQYNTATGKPPILTNNALFAIDGDPGERFYIRFEVGSEENIINEKIVMDNKLRPNSLEITVLADFLPILPTMINTIDSNYFEIGDIDKTQKLVRPLLKGNKLLIYQSDVIEKYNEEINIIPPDTNVSIKALAKSLTKDTPLLTAVSIRNYLLSDDFIYSLDVNESENYVEEFLLETKQGFCIHYTRAFKLLAELNNIPVREVSGYLVDIPIPDEQSGFYQNVSVATGYDAHLWPEILINGEWITFEVTKSIYRDEKVQPEITTFPTNTESTEEKDIIKTQNNSIYLLFIPLLIVLYLSYYHLWHKQYMKRWILRSQRNGVPHPKNTGWIQWCKMSGVETTVEEIIINHYYNSYTLTDDDIKKIRENYYLSRKQFKYSR